MQRMATLRRSIATLAPVLAAAAVAPAPAEATGYCSPTGDYCHSAGKRDGVVRLTLDTFAFRGRVRVCVTAPDDRRTCRRFRLRRRANGVHGFSVRWSAHFPDRGPGRYRVRFRYAGTSLGPADSFRR